MTVPGDPTGTSTSIAVYGASGYTGTLVVAELLRRGIKPLLVGRDAMRLAATAERTGAPANALRVAALDDPGRLRDALAGTDVVINTAGPFARSVDAVVGGAIAAGVHYVDTSGEQLPTKRIFDVFADDARSAGVTVVPGTADDGLPSNLVAQLAADQLTDVDEMTIAVRIVGGASRGSVRSIHEVIAGGALDYLDGAWRPAVEREATLLFPGLDEPTRMSTLALPAVVTVPRHIVVRHITSLVNAELVDALQSIDPTQVDGLPEGPTDDVRQGSDWRIVVDATDRAGRTARSWVLGPDGYALTAVIAVEAARRLAVDGAPAGVLAAAQAFDPATFLDGLAPHGVRWGVEQSAEDLITRSAS